MSYSQLMVFRNHVAEHDEKYRNGNGTSSLVWDVLLHKYGSLVYSNRSRWDIPCGTGGGWTELGKAVSNGSVRLRPWERMCFDWTTENALVQAKHTWQLAAALDRFEDAHQVPGYVCHLGSIAKRMRTIEGVIDAIGLYATSVAENPWFDYADTPERESMPYDLRTGTRHWFIELREFA